MCGAVKAPPTVCPECGSRYIRYFGSGTQRVEEEMHKLFPTVRTVRRFIATTRGRDAHARLLDDDARAVTDLADFVENCKKPLFFVGDGAGLCYNKYSNVAGVLQTPPALRGGRAAAVALVAKQMAAAGQAVLPEALLPDYHRLSQAERERAERLAAEAAANKQ